LIPCVSAERSLSSFTVAQGFAFGVVGLDIAQGFAFGVVVTGFGVGFFTIAHGLNVVVAQGSKGSGEVFGAGFGAAVVGLGVRTGAPAAWCHFAAGATVILAFPATASLLLVGAAVVVTAVMAEIVNSSSIVSPSSMIIW
jgi:hypothetical protein